LFGFFLTLGKSGSVFKDQSFVTTPMSLAIYTKRKPRVGSIVHTTFSIPLSSLTKQELDNEIKNLTMQAKSGFGVPPPPFEAYYISDNRIHIPRFYGLERYGNAETDLRTDGEEINVTFQGSLKSVQVAAVQAFKTKAYASNKNGGGFAVLPCGTGKTVFAINMIAELQRKTLVFVHTTALADQWEERIQTFLPNARIGKIQGGVFDIDNCDVAIAMIMTVAKRKFEPSELSSFGFVVMDEAHHLAAPYINAIFKSISARHLLALSATPQRADGLTPLLHYCIGPEIYRCEGETSDVRISCILYDQGCQQQQKYRNGQNAQSLMLSALAKDKQRTTMIANHVLRLWKLGRRIILLSDRTVQLDDCYNILTALGIPESSIGKFQGSIKRKDRPKSLAKDIVMGTYSLANEGLDEKELDTLILATPRAAVVQAIGRIQRVSPGKKEPLVLDIVDNWSTFAQLRWTRYRQYVRKGFECQTMSSNSSLDDSLWYS
jgi:superfamily II DNA or RNA helicase